MGDLRASDLQHLFHIKDYTRLRALVDEGKALHKFCYRADNPNWWGTILGFAVIEKDAFMFQYIMQTCGAHMLSVSVDSGIGNGYWALHQMLANDDGTYANKRKVEVMVEIALEHGGTAVYEDMRGMVRLRYIADIYRNSCDARCSSITAVVWCCQAIRDADGLAELLGERMHAERAFMTLDGRWRCDLPELFESKDYDTLNQLIDSGRALDRAYAPSDRGTEWDTVLSASIFQRDVPTFRRIIEKYGAGVLKNTITSGLKMTGYDVMEMSIEFTESWAEERAVELMVEIVLENFDGDYDIVYEFLNKSKYLKHIANAFHHSHSDKVDAITAIVWCCQTIRADGLAELLAERMQSESAWEYEPKIKRTKY